MMTWHNCLVLPEKNCTCLKLENRKVIINGYTRKYWAVPMAATVHHEGLNGVPLKSIISKFYAQKSSISKIKGQNSIISKIYVYIGTCT